MHQVLTSKVADDDEQEFRWRISINAFDATLSYRACDCCLGGNDGVHRDLHRYGCAIGGVAQSPGPEPRAPEAPALRGIEWVNVNPGSMQG
jgi:hypothetical protein